MPNNKNKRGLEGFIGVIVLILIICLCFFAANVPGNETKTQSTFDSSSGVKQKVETRPTTYTCNDVEYTVYAEYLECKKRQSWEQVKASALAECNADPNKIECWYDEYPGNYIHWTDVVKMNSCDPNYAGYCVPMVSYDLDCPDIGYNTVIVTGYDRHRFDRDRDGYGCE